MLDYEVNATIPLTFKVKAKDAEDAADKVEVLLSKQPSGAILDYKNGNVEITYIEQVATEEEEAK